MKRNKTTRMWSITATRIARKTRLLEREHRKVHLFFRCEYMYATGGIEDACHPDEHSTVNTTNI
ncbi:hypothetical protein GN244_ATG19286 [Phytophthora infestans]|uniref:Uncharacterized protein n=1 Tax=Phytophthora infestans TaxID=4787 RepID=A0A833SJR2_PHYIN|nr:hypothetical protein GN244_ATG19286 [Phytophthora infestans]